MPGLEAWRRGWNSTIGASAAVATMGAAVGATGAALRAGAGRSALFARRRAPWLRGDDGMIAIP